MRRALLRFLTTYLYNFLKQVINPYSNHAGTFNRNYIIRKLQERVQALRYEENYISHLFRRKAVIFARLARLLKDKIQLLKR